MELGVGWARRGSARHKSRLRAEWRRRLDGRRHATDCASCDMTGVAAAGRPPGRGCTLGCMQHAPAQLGGTWRVPAELLGRASRLWEQCNAR